MLAGSLRKKRQKDSYADRLSGRHIDRQTGVQNERQTRIHIGIQEEITKIRTDR